MATSQLERVVERLRHAAMPRGVGGQTDGQLLECFIARRDEHAFAAIVHRHGPMVLAVCRRLLHQQHDAEDAFQATFLVLVRKASSVVPREMLANWLYGVAYRTALKARTTTAKRWAKEQPMTDIPEPEVVSPDVQSELRPLLDKELNLLPDIYRACIVSCDLEGKTQQQAARDLGWSQGTLSGRLFRARAILAKRLSRRGLVLSAGALAMALSSQGTASAAVPSSLLVSTIRAGSLLAVGEVVIGATSAKVAALTEGVINAMWVTKVTKVSAILVLVSALGFGGTGIAYRMQGTAQASGTTHAVALNPDPKPAQPKKDGGQKPMDQEQLDKVVKQLDEEIRKLEVAKEQERLRQLVKQLEEQLRKAKAGQQPTEKERLQQALEEHERQVRELARKRIAELNQVRAAAASVQMEIEKALETVRKAKDTKAEIEILEEIEKTIKEMKRKAKGEGDEKKPGNVLPGQ